MLYTGRLLLLSLVSESVASSKWKGVASGYSMGYKYQRHQRYLSYKLQYNRMGSKERTHKSILQCAQDEQLAEVAKHKAKNGKR